MSATHFRASLCIIALLAAIAAACRGDVRRHLPDSPPDIRIGTFLKKERLANLLTTEPLVAVGWNGRPVYRLAQSVTESGDGRVLTFELRSNARFHTGERVTAERVRQLLATKPELMQQVTAIEARGDRTIVIRLRRPYSVKPEDFSEYTIYDDTRLDVRTGPLKIASLQPTAVLEPFPQYYQGTPNVASVEIREYATQRAAWTAMMRGEVNVLHELSREAIDFTEAGGDIRAFPLLRPYYVVLGFNMRHPVLARREVRVALTQALDREEVIQKAMRGRGQLAEGPFWPYHWAYSPPAHPLALNPEAASVRLESAGLTVRSAGAQFAPARLRFSCLVLDDTRFERIALVVQRQLFAIGVDVRFVSVGGETLTRRLQAGDFDAFLFEMTSGRTLSWVYRFWHSPAPGARPFLSTGYAAADEALDRMKLAGTDTETRIAVADVMRIMRDDPPAIFLVWPHDVRAVDSALQVPYEPEHDIFGTLWQATRIREMPRLP